MQFYVFITLRQSIRANDIMIARRNTKSAAIRLAKACDAVESYVMTSEDLLTWCSWDNI